MPLFSVGVSVFPEEGELKKSPVQGVKETPLFGWKCNPPYPPLSGGYKKAMRLRRAEGALLFLACLVRRAFFSPPRLGALLFLAPLSRGGRGGCIYGVCLSKGLPLPSQDFFIGYSPRDARPSGKGDSVTHVGANESETIALVFPAPALESEHFIHRR